MHLELQIHSTDSDSQQHPDRSQTRRRSRLRSVVSEPPSRRRLRSRFANEMSPTPTAETRKSQASSPPSARTRRRGQGRRSQLQPSPHWQLTPSPRLPAPGSSPRRTRAVPSNTASAPPFSAIATAAAGEPQSATQGVPPQANQLGDLQPPSLPTAISPSPQQHHLFSQLHLFIVLLLYLLHYANRFSLSKDLTPTDFAFTFSLYRDVICSAFLKRRAELDDYLSIVLDMALRFGGTGFYIYHMHFANQAAGLIQQFNQGMYWGTLDSKLYCCIFAACTSLSCRTQSLVGLPGQRRGTTVGDKLIRNQEGSPEMKAR
eukprot:superscaffoldBa00011695_g25330